MSQEYKPVTIKHNGTDYSIVISLKEETESDFRKVVDSLLHLSVECEEPYQIIIDENFSLGFDTSERMILEKIVAVNDSLNVLKKDFKRNAIYCHACGTPSFARKPLHTCSCCSRDWSIGDGA